MSQPEHIHEVIGQELLKDRRVVEEINRHLWIESEKAGADIGFEKATEDWLKRFSKSWMDYHMPNSKILSDHGQSNNGTPAKKEPAAKSARTKSKK